MKEQAIQYLALDVHQATTVATLRDASGGLSGPAFAAAALAAALKTEGVSLR